MPSPDNRHHQLLIRAGTVIDGTRAPRYDADVAIDGDRIVAIGDLAAHTADQVIDAAGRIVAPGFIDSHTHDDEALRTQPRLPFKVSQGVTTVVTGNCGISAAPVREGAVLPPPLDLIDSGGPRFATFASWLDALRAAPPATNVAALVGHSTLRAYVMPRLDRAASADEVAQMRALLDDALDAGAIGLSTGTFYPPAAHAPTEEIIEVGRPLTPRRAIYATHMRDEADHVMTSIDETLRIGRELDVPVVISHHKVSQRRNHGRSAETLPHIRDAMRHQRVALDCYPYDAGSTMIHAHAGMLECRVRIASSRPHPECAGRDLDDIAREWGVDRNEAAARLQPGSAIYFLMDEGDVQRILAFDETMIGSDGIALGPSPHPRLWGTFPRVLGHYCRGLGLFTLETAVWKMTGLPARNFALAGRGTLAAGQAADLVVFDADHVRDNATYDTPTEPATGIDCVIVNGRVAWQGGHSTGACAGQVLRSTPTLAR